MYREVLPVLPVLVAYCTARALGIRTGSIFLPRRVAACVLSLARRGKATKQGDKKQEEARKKITRTQTQKTATMPYVGRDGTVGGRKSTMKMITDFIQGIFDFVGLFFGAITNPPQRIESRSTVSSELVSRAVAGSPSKRGFACQND
jgi:hypothetical protein